MDKKVKKLWLQALLSGEYKQSKGCLRRYVEDKRKKYDFEYCGLGVLVDLYAKFNGTTFKGVGVNPYDYDLPQKVKKWAGISGKESILFKLAELNDNRSSFKKLARLLRIIYNNYYVISIWQR